MADLLAQTMRNGLRYSAGIPKHVKITFKGVFEPAKKF